MISVLVQIYSYEDVLGRIKHDILKACHDKLCGGYFANKWIAYMVLHMRYYWPTLFKDAQKYVKACYVPNNQIA